MVLGPEVRPFTEVRTHQQFDLATFSGTSHALCFSSAIQVTIRNNETVLIADAANKEEIDARVAQIKKELSETDSVYDTEKLSERVAKLAGGVAVIKVCLAASTSRICCRALSPCSPGARHHMSPAAEPS